MLAAIAFYPKLPLLLHRLQMTQIQKRKIQLQALRKKPLKPMKTKKIPQLIKKNLLIEIGIIYIGK
jgi:hypothetical protein